MFRVLVETLIRNDVIEVGNQCVTRVAGAKSEIGPEGQRSKTFGAHAADAAEERAESSGLFHVACGDERKKRIKALMSSSP